MKKESGIACVAAVAATLALQPAPAKAQDVIGGGGKPGVGAKSKPSEGSKKHGHKGSKIVARAAECTYGDWIIGKGYPLPLPKMSKRQWRRYKVELAFYNKARFLHRVACPFGGTLASGALIAGADFVSRFVTGERPIKRTPRQERVLFWIAGGEPRPNLSGTDPDLYGPR